MSCLTVMASSASATQRGLHKVPLNWRMRLTGRHFGTLGRTAIQIAQVRHVMSRSCPLLYCSCDQHHAEACLPFIMRA